MRILLKSPVLTFLKSYEPRATKIVYSSIYSKFRISRIQVGRQIYPSYAKIQLTGSEIKVFGTIVPKILSEICEAPTYVRFTVHI